MLKRTILDIKGWEQVNHFIDPNTGLDAIIALHNTKLGPAMGGCRYYAYRKDQDQIDDALRLSEGMTYKNSLAGLNLGGGKTTLNGNKPKTKDMLKSLAEALNVLNGTYITGEDVGMTHADIEFLRKHSKFVSPAGDPSPATAYGVLKCIEAAVNFTNESIRPFNFYLEGLGNVGKNLVQMLPTTELFDDELSVIYVAEINQDVFNEKLDTPEMKKLWHDGKIRYCQDLVAHNLSIKNRGIYIPCAFGLSINSNFLMKQNFDVICGSANNQLADIHYAAALAAEGTVYVPDYLANSGGVIRIAYEMENKDPFHIANRIDALYHKTTKLIEASRMQECNIQLLANKMAEERFM